MVDPIAVISIHVGKPRNFSAEETGKDWTSAIIKDPISGPVRVRFTNIEGDQQSDLVHHGGPDKAVLAYPQAHYKHWSSEFPQIDWADGSFGENLTLARITGKEVCIGDIFKVGSCVLQVSQARQPCWKLSTRWGVPKLAVRVQQTRMTGWYLRVLQEGEIEAGQTMTLTERLHPEFTVDFANDVMFAKPRRSEDDRRLAACPELSKSWQVTLDR
ncbi:MOSC domain-containing protein [Aporhodopirellula aestuarii]|uniref:MOSC domain-containing protein n=1 Tax=Aporhodopirellula aestuarii TaxID=2950107 RepID=A0ABT0U5X3_9BACT|nr:MOSC domain-containing protein [Aporhodopirellula aestuarii]MCM2372197.1 MOSC domain-containing protein [Aporhodopirellula aestuarii]